MILVENCTPSFSKQRMSGLIVGGTLFVMLSIQSRQFPVKLLSRLWQLLPALCNDPRKPITVRGGGAQSQ
jgi:hypothetical protein